MHQKFPENQELYISEDNQECVDLSGKYENVSHIMLGEKHITSKYTLPLSTYFIDESTGTKENTIQITQFDSGDIKVDLYKDTEIINSKTHYKNDDFICKRSKIIFKGELQINDTMGVAAGRNSFEFGKTVSGDLVLVKTAKIGGIFVIFPAYVSGSELEFFKRIN